MNIRICKYCEKEFDISDKPSGWMANHTRWCNLNPKRNQYNKDLSKLRAAKKNFNNQYSYGAVCSDETKEKIRNANIGKKHTEETKQLLREKALASPHRRLKKGVVMYKDILLDSSWELELAKRLDKLKIKWIRPDPIPWVDDQGVTHNYFPDFFLTEQNLYLDPKNPQAIKSQKKKLENLLKQYDNIVIIDTLEKCKKYIV